MKNIKLISKIFFWSLLLSAGSSQAITLEEALQTSLKSSPEIKELRLSTEAAKWGETKAFAGHLPKLELTASHLFDEMFEELELEFNGANIVMPAIQPYSIVGLRASIEIFGGFQTMNEVSAAQYAREYNEHRLNRAEEMARAQIRTLFMKALGSQVLVEVAQQNIDTLESHMRDVRARARGGVSTKFDILRVEVQMEEAQSEKLLAQNSVVIQRAKLFEALGVADDGKPLQGQLPTDFSKIDLAKLDLANIEREDRKAQLAAVAEAEKSAKASQAHWYPHIALFGSQEWYNNINHDIWQDDERFKTAYGVGVTMTWNLFDGGASLASQRQAALNKKIQEERLARINVNMPGDIEEAKRHLSYNITNFAAKTSSAVKSEEAVRLAKGAMQAGTITNTEVLDAVLDLNRAKAAVVRSQVEAVEALGALELALGRSI